MIFSILPLTLLFFSRFVFAGNIQSLTEAVQTGAARFRYAIISRIHSYTNLKEAEIVSYLVRNKDYRKYYLDSPKFKKQVAGILAVCSLTKTEGHELLLKELLKKENLIDFSGSYPTEDRFLLSFNQIAESMDKMTIKKDQQTLLPVFLDFLIKNQQKIIFSKGLRKLLKSISDASILADDSIMFQELMKSDLVTNTLTGGNKNRFLKNSFRYAIEERSTQVLKVFMDDEELLKVVKVEFKDLLYDSISNPDLKTFSYLLNTPVFDQFITGEVLTYSLRDAMTNSLHFAKKARESNQLLIISLYDDMRAKNKEIFKMLLDKNEALSRMNKGNWIFFLKWAEVDGDNEFKEMLWEAKPRLQ
jgi:hypothetical protein